MENGKLTAGEIKIGNSIIAKFDGYYEVEDSVWRSPNGNLINFYEFTYNLSYDSLMSIVEKISKLNVRGYTPYFEITYYGCSIDLTKLACGCKFRGSGGENPLINIWIAVVEFLDWYINSNFTN